MIVVAIATAVLGACVTTNTLGLDYTRPDDAPLTARYGTKQLAASGPEAFAAVSAGLRSQGFDVVVANESRGLIRTAPKSVSVRARSVSDDEARIDERAFQVVGELALTSGRVKVVLRLRSYRNGVDVTATELIKTSFLVQLWSQIFDAIYDALPVHADPQVDRGTVL
jgi:hypothetical protein